MGCGAVKTELSSLDSGEELVYSKGYRDPRGVVFLKPLGGVFFGVS